MHSYFLAIPFSESIQSKLASLCYGLPQVQWVERENFYLILRYIGPLSSSQLEEIQERLAPIFFSPFSLVLKGAGHFSSKGKRGSIWIGILNSNPLFTLKKEIDHQLQGFPLPSNERFFPHITLGYYERLNPEKLGDYLLSLADYESEPIKVINCVLIRSKKTPKRIIYDIINHYFASPDVTGED